jgi:hypothetical protein
MPNRQLSQADPFWNHATFSATGANNEGCGYAVTNYPGLTPLGAWASGAVQLGYRDLDRGRVFALEADWQDASRDWTAASTSLMGALITW